MTEKIDKPIKEIDNICDSHNTRNKKVRTEIVVKCPICKCYTFCGITESKILDKMVFSDKCKSCSGKISFTINASVEPFEIDESIKILQDKISANEKELPAISTATFERISPEIENEPLFVKTKILKDSLLDLLISRDYEIRPCISLDENTRNKHLWLIEKKHKEVTTYIGYIFTTYDEAYLWLKNYIESEYMEEVQNA